MKNKQKYMKLDENPQDGVTSSHSALDSFKSTQLRHARSNDRE